jgi:hypothetical protein
MALPEAVRPAPALTGNGSHGVDQLGGVIGPDAVASNAAVQDAVYIASTIKKFRRTKADVASIRDAIREILEEAHPQTVRQVFYALTVRGLIRKAEIEYQQTAIRLLVEMREAGDIPFGWIADNTRWMRKPPTHVGLDACLEATAKFYRRNLWAAMPVYVEVWCEKDALAGVLVEETNPYDVPLMVAKGYSSISFLHSNAKAIEAKGKPTYVYHFGDLDPSGVDAARDIEAKLRRYAPQAEIHFERPAVTRAQVDEWNLPSRPTKTTDTRAKKFVGTSVELDAIPASKLRELVRGCIERHVDQEQLAILRVAEESERETLGKWAKIVKGTS